MAVELELRRCGIENIDNLYWIKGDTGAWTGPIVDWVNNKSKFMKYVTYFGTVVQAGGCCGMYPRFYRNYFKNVITFEPNSDNYACLQKNCEDTDIDHYNQALGLRVSTAKMVYSIPGGDEMNVGMHKIDNSVQGEISVTTVDSLKLPSLDLLHLDIEDSESDALLGAIQTITRYWPVIVTEKGNGKDLLEFIGYEIAETTNSDIVFRKKFW